jgi:hypothetical protein
VPELSPASCVPGVEVDRQAAVEGVMKGSNSALEGVEIAGEFAPGSW